ncbi:MAG: nuclear transport factor 2 family protein [Candidatus Sulfotelmatobacter sp.]
MMQRKRNTMIVMAILVVATLSSVNLAAQTSGDEQLLSTRESVWRAWFAGDTAALEKLVPPETIVISGGEKEWKNQAYVLRSAAEFHTSGGKLIRLEFPHTEVQHFGNVAIVWSTFVLETEENGKRESSSGRATEIFVWKHRRWTNPGWHTSSTK